MRGFQGKKGEEEEEETENECVKCSGSSCGSCTAGIVVDCVAICCCPCSVIDILFLALVKVPWMVGAKSLRFLKRKICKRKGDLGMRERELKQRISFSDEISTEVSESGESGERLCPWFEAEKVLMELVDVGHLGFGRVSFKELRQ
ncbi:hypothetical protein AMTR_s00058p00201770 [Amborella trichopoda]|uniref:Uncharacterized protein n=2 Tax=Amborella trichopoda TaxID=13333 RepID=W1PFG1_AMBTC|nr:hypothetical protein AMTR_s00058p00201770 [Amborella trichopoda]